MDPFEQSKSSQVASQRNPNYQTPLLPPNDGTSTYTSSGVRYHNLKSPNATNDTARRMDTLHGGARGKTFFTRHRARSESKTRFNNQSSILMCAVTGSSEIGQYYIMVLHDTRIFYFFTRDLDLILTGSQLDEKCDELTDIFLHLLTSTKYRILSSFFLLFQMLDRFALIGLFLDLFIANADSGDLGRIITDYKWVFITLAVELFFDLMEYNVKMWILNRIGVYFVMLIFVAYAACFLYHDLFDSPLVVVLYFGRLVSFVLQTGEDFCVDLELAMDLSNEWMSEMSPFYVWDKVGADSEQHRKLNFPPGVWYVGSVCAWGWMNVFEASPDWFAEEKQWLFDSNQNDALMAQERDMRKRGQSLQTLQINSSDPANVINGINAINGINGMGRISETNEMNGVGDETGNKLEEEKNEQKQQRSESLTEAAQNDLNVMNSNDLGDLGDLTALTGLGEYGAGGDLSSMRNNKESIDVGMSIVTVETAVSHVVSAGRRKRHKRRISCCESTDYAAGDPKFHWHRLCLYCMLCISLPFCVPLMCLGGVIILVFSSLKSVLCCKGCQRGWKNTICYELTHEHSF